MRIDKHSLYKAEQAGVLAAGQADALWHYLREDGTVSGRFTAAHVLYYLGGVLAVGAMVVFMLLGWMRWGGWSLLGLALCYGVVGFSLLRYFLLRRQLQLPAALMGMLVVAMIPVGVFGLQQVVLNQADARMPDFLYDPGEYWLPMELAALAGGVALLWRYRLALLVLPVAVTLWFISMSLAALIAGTNVLALESHTVAYTLSLLFGLVVLCLALGVDVYNRRTPDYAFWLYVSGLLSFWLALNGYAFDGAAWRWCYVGINIVLLVVSAMLRRRVFAVFGGLGVVRYVGYLAFDVFAHSVLFPFVLTGVGVLIILAGAAWQRYEKRVGSRLRALLPASIREATE